MVFEKDVGRFGRNRRLIRRGFGFGLVVKFGFSDSADSDVVDEDVSVLKDETELGLVSVEERVHEGRKLGTRCAHLERNVQVIVKHF